MPGRSSVICDKPNNSINRLQISFLQLCAKDGVREKNSSSSERYLNPDDITSKTISRVLVSTAAQDDFHRFPIVTQRQPPPSLTHMRVNHDMNQRNFTAIPKAKPSHLAVPPTFVKKKRKPKPLKSRYHSGVWYNNKTLTAIIKNRGIHRHLRVPRTYVVKGGRTIRINGVDIHRSGGF